MAFVRHLLVGKGAGHVFDAASLVVVEIPFGEIVDAVQVVATTASISVARPFDLPK